MSGIYLERLRVVSQDGGGSQICFVDTDYLLGREGVAPDGQGVPESVLRLLVMGGL